MALLSIVIPTCNRPQYLENVVKLILRSTKNTEIIISDNSDNDNLAEVLKNEIADSFVKYSYIPHKVSVVENFERALEQVTGDYVLYLGDDDGIGPGIEDIVLWMREHSIDAAFSYTDRFIANYYWPGVKSRFFDDKYSARLFVESFTGGVKQIVLQDAMKGVRNAPGTGLNRLPRIYHGIVSASVIKSIKDKYGNVFGGISPDIFSAYQIASIAKSAVQIDYPFVIPGGLKESTAGQRAEKSDTGKLSERDHTARFGHSLVWDERIPEFYSPYNVWAYSLLKAVERVDGNTTDFNFHRLYVISYLRYKQYKDLINEAVAKNNNTSLLSWPRAITQEVVSLTKRIKNKVFKRNKVNMQAENIVEAYDSLQNYININKVKIKFDEYR